MAPSGQPVLAWFSSLQGYASFQKRNDRPTEVLTAIGLADGSGNEVQVQVAVGDTVLVGHAQQLLLTGGQLQSQSRLHSQSQSSFTSVAVIMPPNVRKPPRNWPSWFASKAGISKPSEATMSSLLSMVVYD